MIVEGIDIPEPETVWFHIEYAPGKYISIGVANVHGARVNLSKVAIDSERTKRATPGSYDLTLKGVR